MLATLNSLIVYMIWFRAMSEGLWERGHNSYLVSYPLVLKDLFHLLAIANWDLDIASDCLVSYVMLLFYCLSLQLFLI